MKRLFNSSGLLIGLILVLIGVIGNRSAIDLGIFWAISKIIFNDDNYAEEYTVKKGSIYDGDTLRLIGNNEELKVRLCGIDAPEKEMPLGIEARDYLRSLIAKGDGTVYLVRAGEDRYGRTVAELFMPLKDNPDQEIHLNTEMIMAGMAWHYEQYSGNCPNQYGLEIAEELARDEKVGVYSGSHQPPWEWRKANK